MLEGRPNFLHLIQMECHKNGHAGLSFEGIMLLGFPIVCISCIDGSNRTQRKNTDEMPSSPAFQVHVA